MNSRKYKIKPWIKNTFNSVIAVAAIAYLSFTSINHYYPVFEINGVSMMPSITPKSLKSTELLSESKQIVRNGVYIISTSEIENINVKHPGSVYIKRVVGLPGDTLSFNKRMGTLISINNTPVLKSRDKSFKSFSMTSKDEKTLGATFESDAYSVKVMGDTFSSYFPDEKAFDSLDPKLKSYIDVFFNFPWLSEKKQNGDITTFTLPEGQYFALSDNAVSGTDSRHFGPVNRKSITHTVK